jgi:hypothetical protein
VGIVSGAYRSRAELVVRLLPLLVLEGAFFAGLVAVTFLV